MPNVFGDPALLLPQLFPGRFGQNRDASRQLIVPHFLDLCRFSPADDVLSPLLPWSICADRIANAGFIVSSSLHGIIVADAFGIPVRRLRLSPIEPDFKFHDYGLATGRETLEPASSVDQALAMGPHPPPVFDTAPLFSTFPIDLWS